MNELLAQITTAWDNLSSRERILVGAVGAVLAIAAFVVLVINPTIGALDSAKARVETADQQVRAMMRLHQGSMTIESVPGEGTTVTVRFPENRVVRAVAVA